MIEQKIPEMIAIGIHAGLLAQAGGAKELKCLQRTQRRLAFCDRHRAAGHCKDNERDSQAIKTSSDSYA